MVGTIAPLVKVAKRQWLVSTTLYFGGSVGAGIVVMLLAAAVGRVLGLPAEADRLPLVVSIAAGIGAVVDLRLLPVGVPTLQRSVPQHWWIEYGPSRAALAYGSVLGLGVTTFVPVATFYALLLAAACQGPMNAAAIGATYGFTRALPVLASSTLMALGFDDRMIGRWPLGWPRSFLRRACGGAALVMVLMAVLGPV